MPDKRRRSNSKLHCRACFWLLLPVVVLLTEVPLRHASANSLTDVVYRLTILHNNDGESVLLPRQIETDAGVLQFGGVARFVTLVSQMKQEAVTAEGPEERGVLMVSSGDNFLAGPVYSAGLGNGPASFDAAAMAAIGYDAICVGNHEFDFGPEVLAGFIEEFPGDVPFLAANLGFANEPELAALAGAGRIVKSVVVEKGGHQIGLVGATTEALASVSSPRRVEVGKVVPAVQREIDRLQASGVDKIILLSHLQGLQRELDVVAELQGVDVVVGGGGNELLANPDDELVPGEGGQVVGPYPIVVRDADGRAVPVVTTNGRYSYLGRLVVGFDRLGEVVDIDFDKSGPILVAGPGNPMPLEPDPGVESAVVNPVREEVDKLAKHVLGVSSVPLDGRRHRVRTGETNLGSLVADAMLWQARYLAETFDVQAPHVAVQNGGGIRNDDIIPAGAISEFDTFEVAPFPNFISIVTGVSRADFKAILESAVSRGEGPAGRFPQIGGFSMTWDAAGLPRRVDDDGELLHPGTRVREVALDDGTEIVTNGELVAGAGLNVATVDFLARGGDDYPFRGTGYVTLGVTYQQALRNYIVEALNGEITEERYPSSLGRIVRKE